MIIYPFQVEIKLHQSNVVSKLYSVYVYSCVTTAAGAAAAKTTALIMCYDLLFVNSELTYTLQLFLCRNICFASILWLLFADTVLTVAIGCSSDNMHCISNTDTRNSLLSC